MRKLPLFALLLLFTSSAHAVEYVTLIATQSTPSETMTLAAGDFAEWVSAPPNFQGLVEVERGGQVYTMEALEGPTSGSPLVNLKLAGPITFKLKWNGMPTAIQTVAITRAGSPSASTPANAAVIPEDAGGQYQVILESSTDLITWTAANPGTYGGSTQKRFFRTRIVRMT